MHNYPLLASKQTSARIDFLRQGGRLVGKKGTLNVKKLHWKIDRFGLVSWQIGVGKLTSSSWRVDKFGLASWQIWVGELTDLGWQVDNFGLASWQVWAGELTGPGWRVDKFGLASWQFPGLNIVKGKMLAPLICCRFGFVLLTLAFGDN